MFVKNTLGERYQVNSSRWEFLNKDVEDECWSDKVKKNEKHKNKDDKGKEVQMTVNFIQFGYIIVKDYQCLVKQHLQNQNQFFMQSFKMAQLIIMIMLRYFMYIREYFLSHSNLFLIYLLVFT